MSVKRELGMAKEYLKKRLADTEDALNIHLDTPFKAKGDNYLREKVVFIKEAISMIEDIIPPPESGHLRRDKK